jgi:hypothetical protein
LWYQFSDATLPMKMVKGTIESVPPDVPSNRFVVKFPNATGQEVIFTGNSDVTVTPFNGAEIDCEVKNPVETHTFTGLVGGGHVSITLGDGDSFRGPIVGGPSTPAGFDGSGVFNVTT